MKPHYETYRHTKKICSVHSQSIVECRLAGGEIGRILAVRSTASAKEWRVLQGVIEYSGKLTLTIVYEDGDKNLCRVERGAEFSHRVEEKELLTTHFAEGFFHAEDTKWKREGGSIYLSTIVSAQFEVFGEEQAEYLYDGEGLLVKRENQTVSKIISIEGKDIIEDEFETDYIADVLIHTETPHVLFMQAENGQAVISGEVLVNLCAVKEDGSLCSYERMIPFKMEVDEEDCEYKMPIEGKVVVQNATFSISSDEEKGKSAVGVEIELFMQGLLHRVDEIPCVVDCYSKEEELILRRGSLVGVCAVEQTTFTERVSGVCAISAPIGFATVLLCLLRSRVEVDLKRSENGGEVEGCIFADLLIEEGGEREIRSLSLPFVFPVPLEKDYKGKVYGACCGLSVRQKKEGECLLEGTLKIRLEGTKEACCHYVDEVESGEAKEQNTSGISIYLPKKGEGCFEMAKRLNVEEEEVKKINPDLSFPLQGGERIFVYRQNKGK